jgi:hypothetical protein
MRADIGVKALFPITASGTNKQTLFSELANPIVAVWLNAIGLYAIRCGPGVNRRTILNAMVVGKRTRGRLRP